MTSIPSHFNRKEVGALLGISYMSVVRSEEQLGLLPAKEVINKRHIRYKALMVLAALEARGFEIPKVN